MPDIGVVLKISLVYFIFIWMAEEVIHGKGKRDVPDLLVHSPNDHNCGTRPDQTLNQEFRVHISRKLEVEVQLQPWNQVFDIMYEHLKWCLSHFLVGLPPFHFLNFHSSNYFRRVWKVFLAIVRHYSQLTDLKLHTIILQFCRSLVWHVSHFSKAEFLSRG